jgi:hypothetical protein
MIARIEIEYVGREKLVEAAKTDEGYAVLKEIFGSHSPEREHAGEVYRWPVTDTLIDIETDGPRLTALGISFTIKNFKGCLPLASCLPETRGPVTVQVSIPNIGLLMMNEVTCEENCCTDRLQDRLDEGWRILCVCPPNGTPPKRRHARRLPLIAVPAVARASHTPARSATAPSPTTRNPAATRAWASAGTVPARPARALARATPRPWSESP